MSFKCKITEADVTIHLPPEELIAMGYRRISNAYCHIARIDRDDWLEKLADVMHCSVAHFYNRDGSGVSDEWRDFYVRSFSKDVHTVSPAVIGKIPPYR